MSNYQIEKLTKSNLSFMDELYTKVYRKKRSPLYYENKYKTDYIGAEAFGYFALFEGNAIGFVGVIPVNLSITGKTIMGAQLVDAMIDIQHRHKGLFELLLKKILSTANTHLIKLLFVFPNQDSFHLVVNKLGFTHLHTMNSYLIKSKDSILKKITRKFWQFNFEKQHGLITNNLLELGYDGIIYEDCYLNYKKYNPNFIFENGNYAVWISDSRKAWLGAINMTTENSLHIILDVVSKKYNSKSFTYLVSPHNELDALFSKIVPAQAGFPVCVYDLTGEMDLSKLKFQFADVDVF